jgi:hypothetical protein
VDVEILMLKSRLLPIATCCLGIALLVSSSGWFGKTADDDEKEVTDSEKTAAAPASFFDDVEQPPAATLKPSQIDLRVGDRYAFLKTVEQRITQDRAVGAATGSSRLTIGLSLEIVDTVSDDELPVANSQRNAGDKLFSVRYRNVKLVQDIPGQEVNYDSDHPNGPVPPQAEAYHGLPGHGFSFWLDKQNQLRSLVGFQDFLQTCLQNAAPEQRTIVWKSLAGMSEADHLATFVDDGLGILPLDSVERGKSWRRERTIHQPLPINLQLTYTIEEVKESLVELAVGGTVTPQAAREFGSAQLQIVGGRISGRCTIDRHTGLPQNCRVEQVLKMVVQLPGGESIPQTKQTVTQLTAVPDSDNLRVPIPYAGMEKESRLR